jgi:hypothetical protein
MKTTTKTTYDEYYPDGNNNDKWVLLSDVGYNNDDKQHYNDGYDEWAEQVVKSFTDKFYDANEDWCVDGSYESQCNKWMQKLFKRNLNDGTWVEPNDAARIITRAHRVWVDK